MAALPLQTLMAALPSKAIMAALDAAGGPGLFVPASGHPAPPYTLIVTCAQYGVDPVSG